MYGIFAYILLIFRVNSCKFEGRYTYQSHGSYGIISAFPFSELQNPYPEARTLPSELRNFRPSEVWEEFEWICPTKAKDRHKSSWSQQKRSYKSSSSVSWLSRSCLLVQKSKDHLLRLVGYPIVYRVLYVLSGAGFFPSTVGSLGMVYLPNSVGSLC